MWSLTLPGQVRFGRGVADAAAGEAARLSATVALVRGRSADAADRLLEELRAQGCAVTVIEARGEPNLAAVMQAREAARAAQVGAVIAIGGGSVIDLGKAVAGLTPQTGEVADYLEVVGNAAPLAAAPLPLIALPTTAGTGAEATKNAVIGVPEHGVKVSLRDPRLLPRLALVDPALTDGCPDPVTLASGLDAIVQVIEPYLSARANPVTDALCAYAIPRGLTALPRLMEGDDARARDAMAHVSLTGGIALANAGLGAVHGLAGVIGGRTGLAHGAICGRLLVPVLRVNRAALRDAGLSAGRIDRVADWIAEALGVSSADALDSLTDWIDAQGLPRLPAQDHPDWAAAARRASSMKANPVPLSEEQLCRALAEAV